MASGCVVRASPADRRNPKVFIIEVQNIIVVLWKTEEEEEEEEKKKGKRRNKSRKLTQP
jgi:hypothetical protein